MALAFNVSQNHLISYYAQLTRFRSPPRINGRQPPRTLRIINSKKKKCLRCNTCYQDKDNSPIACSFHGHFNGDKGLFALAPPHQGIDGEWSDGSGVIVYKWNDKTDRPNTGRDNWKKRWSCCAEYDENAPPCQRGWHLIWLSIACVKQLSDTVFSRICNQACFGFDIAYAIRISSHNK
ncbi:hypothetical protein OSB04_012995 [Centaurea solstitialis]|uniref:Uncharacterized protein n=1 Tax=Centaurea solstitialis TaxID=347529 RepID=A0AA38WR03_9ASTR|nr:hypothetical protein OSB04_012995 [Centaurea solstitialis]